MPLKLLPMPQSEWHLYYQLCSAAFRPGIMSVMFPGGISQQDSAMGVASMKRVAARHPDRVQLLKVVDSDLPDDDPFAKIVGVSNWKVFAEERTEEEVQKEMEEAERDEEIHGVQPGLDKQVAEDFHGVVAEYRTKHVGRKSYMLLHVLATRPGQGRRGVGAMAMRWGCEKADELGVPVYLEGSPKGVGLYRQWGFEVVDELPWDATRYGYGEALTHLCMKRLPRERE